MIADVPLSSSRPPVVLSIAGSDSGGGAGIQADLKAFAATGVHGATAITALTAQNTVEVRAVAPVAPAMIRAQVSAVIEDLGVDAVKIGMLGDAATAGAVADALEAVPPGIPIVHDPVMVAESGAVLLDPDALSIVRERIVPRATVITPNLPEARVLSHAPEADGVELLAALFALGSRWVLVTGGHRDEATDLLYDGDNITALAGPRFPDGAAHGSGCTHAATLAARLALGDSVPAAARYAREAASRAVRDGLRGLGAGAGPANIFGFEPNAPA